MFILKPLFWREPFVFYFGSPSPPPIIIPPPPPPPPPMPDIGSLQALEAQRERLAAQMRSGRLSTDLTDDGQLRRGGRGPLGMASRNNLGPAGVTSRVSNPAAPLYQGALLGAAGGGPPLR